jgi:uncharacterized protein
MILNKNYAILSILLFVMFFVSTNVFAESSKDIQSRMKARLPEINQLKTSGVIGEGNDGFLGFVAGASGNEAIIKAENNDRRKVYSAISKQQGATLEVVGNRRALQISQKAKPGTWLQDSKGAWYKK